MLHIRRLSAQIEVSRLEEYRHHRSLELYQQIACSFFCFVSEIDDHDIEADPQIIEKYNVVSSITMSTYTQTRFLCQ